MILSIFAYLFLVSISFFDFVTKVLIVSRKKTRQVLYIFIREYEDLVKYERNYDVMILVVS